MSYRHMFTNSVIITFTKELILQAPRIHASYSKDTHVFAKPQRLFDFIFRCIIFNSKRQPVDHAGLEFNSASAAQAK
ncbi:MAG: hypothetical protein ACE5PO_01005 [Candidatus Bathyarchaeia archaeon]